jgi:hypothetical protein
MKRKNILTYILNLETNIENQNSILQQFKGRDEFAINLIVFQDLQFDATGVWNKLKEIIDELEFSNDEYIVVCLDDHKFSSDYCEQSLLKLILDAQGKESDILLGGIASFNDAIQIDASLFWIDLFFGARFMVIFRRFFGVLLRSNFTENDKINLKISLLSQRIVVAFPFLSMQNELPHLEPEEHGGTDHNMSGETMHSSERLQRLIRIKDYYQGINIADTENDVDINNVLIPAYVINLPERTDRLAHIKMEFEQRREFEVSIMEACKHKVGAIGLWHSIVRIIEIAKSKDEDVIVIFEDDHQFSDNYSGELLINCILKGNEFGADLLSGGIGNFRTIVPVTDVLWWIDDFWATQFIVVYSRFFQAILDESFNEGDSADGKFSEMTSNKMVIFPFVSVQKDFGYSDICLRNDYRSNDTFNETSFKIENLKEALYMGKEPRSRNVHLGG